MAKQVSVEEREVAELREMLLDCRTRYGTKTAFREKKDGIYQDISYARFATEAEALATVLSVRFSAGDRVLIIGDNSYRWALSYMALTVLGAVPVPVDAMVRLKDLAEIITKSEAKGVLYAPEERRKKKAFVGLAAVCFDKYPVFIAEGKRRLADRVGENDLAELDPNGLAAIFFTPGATKGVMLSHANILTTVRGVAEAMAIGREDVFLSHLPLSHSYECICGLLAPLYLGATVAFAEGLSHLMRNMREVHPTCMVTLPFIAGALYRKIWQGIEARGNETKVRRRISISDPVRPLSARQALKERLLAAERGCVGYSLNRLIVLGGGMDAAVQKGLRQLGIFTVQGYGVTECAGLAAISHDDRYRDGAAGLPFADAVIDIYNEQPDGSGEIRYKGDNVMLGYLSDPERTQNALRGGWYYTGDIGRIDAAGFLHVLGRRQNCIENASGRLICPEELERLLCQSPFIKEAVVVGVLNPETKDSEPAALILTDRAYLAEMFGDDLDGADPEIAVDEWIAHINEELEPYQQIGLYALRDKPFPRDRGGRVQRAKLAKEIAEAIRKAK
ncbi:MAG: AMP-binding protein [Clostridia bacterium]|nr:AMP-binding protein [Clostridia bacterium]